MNSLLLVCALATLALAGKPIARHYHQSVGIPEAARIKQAELAADFDSARIVGGFPAAAGSHPHLIGVLVTMTTGSQSVCGATMLSNTRAVTAAQCWWDGFFQARQFALVFGTGFLFIGGTRVVTDKVEVHENWDFMRLHNDIAIISFDFVPYTNVIQRALVPSGSLLNEDFVGVWAHAAGYGRTNDTSEVNQAQAKNHVWLQVIENEVCRNVFGQAVIESTLCTSGYGGAGMCGGDNGGPLVITSGGQRVLIGVMSFYSARGCTVGMPTATTRVTSFASWINARL